MQCLDPDADSARAIGPMGPLENLAKTLMQQRHGEAPLLLAVDLEAIALQHPMGLQIDRNMVEQLALRLGLSRSLGD